LRSLTLFLFSPADGDLDAAGRGADDVPVPAVFKVEPNEESRSFADYDDTSQSSSQPTLEDVKTEVKQGEADALRGTAAFEKKARRAKKPFFCISETLDLESDTEETEFDDDEFDDNDPYSFSEDEAGLSPRQRKCSKPKIEKMKFDDR
jgi:Na+-transporting NADH:ubiquinone oxidoreductase subunit NqrA